MRLLTATPAARGLAKLGRTARNDSFALIRRTISAATLLLASSLLAQENWARHVVISEISPREGYIELYNPTEVSQNLEGYEIQTMAAHKKSWRTRVKFGKGSRLAPFGYFLVASLRTSLSVKADIAEPFSFGLLPEEGSLRLLDASGRQVDLVGWGPRSFSEGNPAPKADVLERLPSLYNPRGGNGQDTDDNGKDFLTRKNPEPQSSASLPEAPVFSKSPRPLPETSIGFKAEGLYERALLDFKEGRFFSAYDKLEKVAVLIPNHPARERLRNYSEDIRQALSSGDISKRNEPLARACLLFIRGEYALARKALRGLQDSEEMRRAIQRIGPAPATAAATAPRAHETPKSPLHTDGGHARQNPPAIVPFNGGLTTMRGPVASAALQEEISILRRNSEGAERLYFEGLSFYARGMRLQAVEVWRKAAALDPEDLRPRKALKRVKSEE